MRVGSSGAAGSAAEIAASRRWKSGDSELRPAPTAFTKTARSGQVSTVVAPGEKPPARSRADVGIPPPTPAAQSRTVSGTSLQGRWTPAAGTVGEVKRRRALLRRALLRRAPPECSRPIGAPTLR